MTDESYGLFLHCKAPLASESLTIIEDCHGVELILYKSPVAAMAPQQVIVDSAADRFFPAAKVDEYHGISSWPKTTIYADTKPPRGNYFPQGDIKRGNQAPYHTIKRPVIPGNVGFPQTAKKVMTSDEAVKFYGGYVITEYRNKIQNLRG